MRLRACINLSYSRRSEMLWQGLKKDYHKDCNAIVLGGGPSAHDPVKLSKWLSDAYTKDTVFIVVNGAIERGVAEQLIHVGPSYHVCLETNGHDLKWFHAPLYREYVRVINNLCWQRTSGQQRDDIVHGARGTVLNERSWHL